MDLTRERERDSLSPVSSAIVVEQSVSTPLMSRWMIPGLEGVEFGARRVTTRGSTTS